MKKASITNGGKVCCNCKLWKPLADFPEKGQCRACRTVWFSEYRERRKREALEYYGAICVCCGETEQVFLTFDHVNGGGNKERKGPKRTGNTAEMVHRAIKEGHPEKFQILCFNCNWAKHAVGICPHQR